MSKKIWLIQTGERLPLSSDIRKMRTALLAEAFVQTGATVSWFTSNFCHYNKEFLKDTEIEEFNNKSSYNIIAIPALGYRTNISIRRFLDHYYVSKSFTKLAAKQARPDIIVCATPDHRLAYECFCYARDRGIEFCLDLRDLWPWDIINNFSGFKKFILEKLMLNDTRIAKETIRNADVLITMMRSWESFIYSEIGRKREIRDACFYLGADTTKSEISLDGKFQNRLSDIKNCGPIITYIGAFNNKYTPYDLINYANDYPDQNLQVVLGGSGDHLDKCKQLASNNPRVHFLGYLSQSEITYLLKQSSAAFLGANGTFPALPNKLYTYLSEGLPIITNMNGELLDILNDLEIGFRYSDLASLSDAINQARACTTQIRANAKSFFQEHLDATTTYRKMANHILHNHYPTKKEII